jgi:hypothetical protein
MLDNVIVSNVITYLRVMITFQTALMFISISLYRFIIRRAFSKQINWIISCMMSPWIAAILLTLPITPQNVQIDILL